MTSFILLGGAGYIGSHVAKALVRAGLTPIIVDNLSRGQAQSVAGLTLEQADILDTPALVSIFKKYQPSAILHFAGLIEVSESVKNPSAFHRNNAQGTASVISAMAQAQIKHLIFSSTAAVYGQPDHQVPFPESLPPCPINPYGESKFAAEQIIQKAYHQHGIGSVIFRFFNACGADIEAAIGEMHDPETHLIPLVIQTALELRGSVSLFGEDYPTPDGTCIRDYVHVEDIARAHLLALTYLQSGGEPMICNLGSGTGYSVREVMSEVKKLADQEYLSITPEPRRAGDPVFLVADISRAYAVLGWKPRYTLRDICASAYRWHQSEIYQNFWRSRRRS